MVAQFHNSYVEAEIHTPTLEDLGTQVEESGATFHTYLDQLIQGLQKEAKEKFKGWVTCSSTDNTDLAFKKVISVVENYPQKTTSNNQEIVFALKTATVYRLGTHMNMSKTLASDCEAIMLHIIKMQTVKPDY